MKMIETVFGKIIIDESAPKDSILLLPPIKRTRHENFMTGEVTEIWEWNPKAGGIITNVKS